MHTLNHTLDKKVMEADGCYLDAQGLRPLEQFVQSYTTRLEIYQQLRDRSQPLLDQALAKFGQTYPDIVQKHGKRCMYDMGEVLRYIALSILRDDEVFFTEQMMSWLDTILLAHKKQTHCAVAYRALQEAINASLPPTANSLIRPYFESVINTLQSHA